MQLCPNCGAASPARFRLCGHCGTELRPDMPQEIRRQVTVLFSDLKGSTSLGESLDSEALFEVLARYFDAMRAELERHGGKIEKLIGDAIVAVFGLPISHPDDPLRAVRAAADCQAALAVLDDDLERAYGVRLVNRTGLASGEVTVGLPKPGEHVLTGQVIQLAMQLEAAAPAMGVLLAESTYRAVGQAAVVEPVPLPADAGHGTADTGDGECAYELVRVVAPDAARPADGEAGSGAGDAVPTVVFCPNCGERNPSDFLVCGTCGTRLGEDEGGQESRKTVTIVFCDLRATDVEGRPLPPATLRTAITRGFAITRGVVERHGGSAEKFIGDALVAVFGLPVLHEDDALRAARAALAIQVEVARLDEELREERIRLTGRVGVNTGLVVAGDATPGLHLVTGDAVNTAARLEQAAPEHGILLGHSTYSLVRDAVEVEAVEPLTLKGKAEPVIAHRLVAVRGQEGRTRRHDAPMVGREAELAVLQTAWHQSVVQNGPRLVTVLGDAGIGKSRLVREFEGYLGGDALVLRGRCLAYGEGITFWPMIEMIRSAADIQDDDTPTDAHRKVVELLGDRAVADRITAIAGLTDMPFPLVELFWGARRFFEILAARRPLVAVIDGVHWAEPTMVDLLEHVVATASEAPIQVICLARDELLEKRPDWAPGSRSTRVALLPVPASDGRRIVDHLLGADHDAATLRDRVVEAGQGNPLFMEQMISLLVDQGALRFDEGRWIRADEAVEVSLPPSIQALLAARVDQLPRDERGVIEPAAVVGYEFGQPAVEALVSEVLRPKVQPGLESLTSRQLVRPDPDAPAGDLAYRFKNLLVRDAAYQGLLKRSRVALHERYVGWVDTTSREHGREREFEALLGFHLEQAYRYRTEFGPPDAEALAVGRDAARRLASAGRRALARGDMAGASNLLGRAAAVLPERDAQRLALLPDTGEALLGLGEFEAAEKVLGGALTLAGELGDDGAAAHAGLVQTIVRFHQGGDVDGWSSHALALAEAAVPVFERLEDHAGLARAWRVIFGVHGTACRYGVAAEAAEQVLEHARLAGEARQEARGAGYYASAALLGPTPVPEALRRCAEILGRVQGDRQTEASILLAIAELEGMAGTFDAARDHYERARSMLNELGKSFAAASTSINSWRVEYLAGDLAAAEQQLRRDFEALDSMGERYMLSSVSVFLGRVLLAQGRLDEAAAMAARARELADADDVEAQALWRNLEARILVRRGLPDEAEALARDALEVLRSADAPVLRADTLVGLAEVLEAEGLSNDRDGAPGDDARRVLSEALELYEAKGSLAAAAQVRQRVEAARVTLTAAPDPL